jgi:hypothetical protein
VASLDDVAVIALALPEAVEESLHGWRSWRVRKKLFAWERPLSEKEIAAIGWAPDGDVLGVRVPDDGARTALLESEPEVFFTTPHFDRSPTTVLIRLDRIPREELEETVIESWLTRAPNA